MGMNREIAKKDRVLLVILGLLIAFAAYYFLIHKPVTNDIANLQIEIEESQNEVTLLLNRQLQMSKMKEELKHAHEVPIPDYDNLKQVIVFLHSIMPSTAEFDIQYKEPEPVSEGSSILARALSMSFTANSYETARRMLSHLENSPYRCQLDLLEIAPLDSDSPITNGAVRVSLTTTFFEYLEPQAEPEAEAEDSAA